MIALPLSLRTCVFAISADYERRTGGWIYDQRLMRELRDRGWTIRDVVLPAGFPEPDDRARAQAADMLAGLPGGTLVIIDQLCLGVMPDVARDQAHRLRMVMIVHHPLSSEAGISADQHRERLFSEREALRHVALAIVTSHTTARDLRDNFDVSEDRIVVAVPGVDEQPIAIGASGDPVMLSVGAVVPRKDHGALISALAELIHLPWHLNIVGNVTRAPEHVLAVRSLIARYGLSDRVTLCGEYAEAALDRAWGDTDLYVAASLHEGFGMAISEAIARGIPVVATAAGAVSEWLDPSAAILVEPGNVTELREALSHALSNPAIRVQLRRGALEARNHLPRWEETAEKVDDSLTRLVAD